MATSVASRCSRQGMLRHTVWADTSGGLWHGIVAEQLVSWRAGAQREWQGGEGQAIGDRPSTGMRASERFCVSSDVLRISYESPPVWYTSSGSSCSICAAWTSIVEEKNFRLHRDKIRSLFNALGDETRFDLQSGPIL